MASLISSFLCPVIKRPVEMRVGFGTANLLSEVHGCTGSEACAATNQLAGRLKLEWRDCPVLRSHLGLPTVPGALELNRLDAPPVGLCAELPATMNRSENPPHRETAAISSVPTTQSQRCGPALEREAVGSGVENGPNGARLAPEAAPAHAVFEEWKPRSADDALPARADLAAENLALKAELARVHAEREILRKSLGVLSELSKHTSSISKR